jgi:ribonuclease P protein component
MLPKKYRLPKREFKEIFKSGKRIHSPYFTIVYKKDLKLENPQIAVVVGLKVDKRATRRNKVKRRIKTILKDKLEDIPHNIKVIITTKNPVVNLKFENLHKILSIKLDQL